MRGGKPQSQKSIEKFHPHNINQGELQSNYSCTGWSTTELMEL